MAWDRPNCRSSLGGVIRASFVKADMDQCLVDGFFMTYVYQMMIAGVVAISAIAISAHVHQDKRARSSQVKRDSMLKITRCLDSASDNYQAGEINSYS